VIEGPPPAPAVLTIEVTNVRNAVGRVHVDICDQASFLKTDCRYAAEAPAHAGVTVVTVRNLPPGDYALQVYHDENGNRRVDRGLFGIPKEGIGFSRDAPIRLRPPRWEDAVMTYHGGAARTALRLRYFWGPGGAMTG
jgi:uncharacterized protein (DUF2141 family)